MDPLQAQALLYPLLQSVQLNPHNKLLSRFLHVTRLLPFVVLISIFSATMLEQVSGLEQTRWATMGLKTRFVRPRMLRKVTFVMLSLDYSPHYQHFGGCRLGMARGEREKRKGRGMREAYRMPKTFLLIILSITLRNRQPIISIIQEHAVVRDIAHETATTTAC